MRGPNDLEGWLTLAALHVVLFPVVVFANLGLRYGGDIGNWPNWREWFK